MGTDKWRIPADDDNDTYDSSGGGGGGATGGNTHRQTHGRTPKKTHGPAAVNEMGLGGKLSRMGNVDGQICTM